MNSSRDKTPFYAYRSTNRKGNVRYFPAPDVTPQDTGPVALSDGETLERRGPFATWQEAHDETRRWEGKFTWAEMRAAREEHSQRLIA